MVRIRAVLATALAVVCFAGAGVVGARPASAALMTFALTGEITAVDPGSVPGLVVGDPVTGSVTFDDALVTGAVLDFVPLDGSAGLPGGGLELTFPAGLVLTEADDPRGTGFPALVFTGGSFFGVDFVALGLAAFGATGLDVTVIPDFAAFEPPATFEFTDGTGQVVARGTLDRVTAIAVPAPWAVLALPALIAVAAAPARKAARHHPDPLDRGVAAAPRQGGPGRANGGGPPPPVG